MEEKFSYKDLVIAYEDNHIIVVVKPQNIPSQEDETKDVDMLNVVKEYIKVKYEKKGEAYVGLVHRLDRPTGGLMVFAKTSKAAARLTESIQSGDMEKKYLCITCGVPVNKKATLVNYLRKNADKNIVEVVHMSTKDAKKAELDYEVLDSLQDYGLVKISLNTGRSHQIRVQLSNIGYPLYGDKKYGGRKETLKNNLALWATELSFTHPTLKQRMKFIAYPPEDVAPWKAFQLTKYLNVNKIKQSPYLQTLINSQDRRDEF